MTRAFLFAMSALALGGWSASQTNRGPAGQPDGNEAFSRSHMMAQQETYPTCPMIVEDTTIHVRNVEGGAALTFTTTKGNAANLRLRVEHMAEMHNRHQPRGGTMHGHRGYPHGSPPPGRWPYADGITRGWGMMMTMVPADARAEHTENGARIVFTPRDPNQLSALREQIRRSADRLIAGQCPHG